MQGPKAFFELITTASILFVLLFMMASYHQIRSIRRTLQMWSGFALRPLFIVITALARRRDKEHITGYRWAYLIYEEAIELDPEPIIKFGALHNSHRNFDTDAYAKCAKNLEHPAPEIDCSCGFYSLRVRQLLGWVRGSLSVRHGLADRNRVILQVDVSGKVIKGNLGYRAERQRVLKVSIKPVCGLCSDRHHIFYKPWWRRPPATNVALLNNRVVPSCDFCYTTFYHKPLWWLADKLGTEVVWAGRSPM